MSNCRHLKEVEAWFDGAADSPALSDHLNQCATCADHLQFLESSRSTIAEFRNDTAITDEQFPAFMRGIREGIEQPAPRRFVPVWSLLSASAAALLMIVAFFAFSAVTPRAVEAQSIVDQTSSEIAGAQMKSSVEADGSATVWVSLPEGDLW